MLKVTEPQLEDSYTSEDIYDDDEESEEEDRKTYFNNFSSF
jgi:hypothetical protein